MFQPLIFRGVICAQRGLFGGSNRLPHDWDQEHLERHNWDLHNAVMQSEDSGNWQSVNLGKNVSRPSEGSRVPGTCWEPSTNEKNSWFNWRMNQIFTMENGWKSPNILYFFSRYGCMAYTYPLGFEISIYQYVV